METNEDFKTLDILARENSADKKFHLHDYTTTYDRVLTPLRYKEIKLFELGIARGRSHKMWAEYFPKGEIYGIDLFVRKHLHEIPRVHLEVCDQTDREQLENYGKKNGPFDVVIDDGCHHSEWTIQSFEVFWPTVKPGGVYFVEDTFFSYHKDLPECYTPPTVMGYFLDLANRICKPGLEQKGSYYAGYDRRSGPKSIEVLSEWHKTVESISFQMGLIMLTKRGV